MSKIIVPSKPNWVIELVFDDRMQAQLKVTDATGLRRNLNQVQLSQMLLMFVSSLIGMGVHGVPQQETKTKTDSD